MSDNRAWCNDGPRRFEQPGSYALPDAHTIHNVTYEHGHSLGEVVTAAVEAGLVIERLEEHVEVETDVGRGLLRPEEDGLLRWRVDGELLPVLYSLEARKPG